MKEPPFRQQKGLLLLLMVIAMSSILLVTLFSLKKSQEVPQTAGSTPALERQELLASDAVTGDGGNGWSNNKPRIIRTSDDQIFTAYSTTGQGYSNREFHLLQRTASGWKQILTG